MQNLMSHSSWVVAHEIIAWQCYSVLTMHMAPVCAIIQCLAPEVMLVFLGLHANREGFVCLLQHACQKLNTTGLRDLTYMRSWLKHHRSPAFLFSLYISQDSERRNYHWVLFRIKWVEESESLSSIISHHTSLVPPLCFLPAIPWTLSPVPCHLIYWNFYKLWTKINLSSFGLWSWVFCHRNEEVTKIDFGVREVKSFWHSTWPCGTGWTLERFRDAGWRRNLGML